MGKTININLFDQKSIQAAVKALRNYENSLEYKCRLLAETMAEKGVEIARVQISDLDAIFNQELLRSIHAEYVGSVKGGGVWAVVAGTDHALLWSLAQVRWGQKTLIRMICRKVLHGNTTPVKQFVKHYKTLKCMETLM